MFCSTTFLGNFFVYNSVPYEDFYLNFGRCFGHVSVHQATSLLSARFMALLSC